MSTTGPSTAFTVKLTPKERDALEEVKRYHGLTTAADAFRFMLAKEHRTITPPPVKGDA